MVTRNVLSDILAFADHLLKYSSKNDLPVTIVVIDKQTFEQPLATGQLTVGHINRLWKVKVVYAESITELVGIFEVSNDSTEAAIGIFGAFTSWEYPTIEETETLIHLMCETEHYKDVYICLGEPSSDIWNQNLFLEHHNDSVLFEHVLQKWNVIYSD